MIKKLLPIIFIVLSLSAKSAHIVGGSMTYVCLGGNTYEITLKLYRDCFSGGAEFDVPGYFTIFDDNFDVVTLNNNSFSDPIITLLDPNVGDTCNITPVNVCVQEGVYTTTIELPDNLSGYYIVYQRCCRNATIINLEFPSDQGTSVVAYIPPGEVVECNSSAVYNNFPPLRICIGNPLVFDHSATDPDGDSLVYELCAPFLGADALSPQPFVASNPPYSSLNYATGYSADYPLASNPALAIDPETGLLTGTPTQLGQFVVGICVKEYREGVLVTVSKRDFQFNVSDCVNGILAEIDGVVNDFGVVFSCNGLEVFFNNNSVNANAYFWDFGVEGTESDTSTLEFPTFTFPDYGTYNITLIAKNPCLSDTSIKPFLVSFTPPASFEYEINCDSVTFTNLSPDTLDYIWFFGDGDTSLLYNDYHIYEYGNEYNAVLSVINEDGCASFFEEIIEIQGFPEPNFVAIIDCLDAIFNNQSDNSTTYTWSFGDGETSSIENLIHTYTAEGDYTVILTASNDCGTAQIEQTVTTIGPPEANYSFDETCNLVVFLNNSVQGETFNWNFGDNSTCSSAVNPTHYYNTGNYPVQLIASNNCGADTLTNTIDIGNIPIADFSYQIECDSVIFTNQSNFSNNFIWQFGDGNGDSTFQTGNLYNAAGNYTAQLISVDLEGCKDTLTTQVVIPEKPIALFSNLAICNQVTFENLSTNSLNYQWQFGDGQNSEEVNPIITYDGQGNYTVTLVAVGLENCKSIAEQSVEFSNPELEEMLVPNTFSPNGDFFNEVFKITNNNRCYDYTFCVFNRWGQLVYDATNNQPEWDGKFNGKLIEPGVYFYSIESNGKQKKGSINLFR